MDETAIRHLKRFPLPDQYASPADAKTNPEVSPILADVPPHLPPFHFITSGMDSLNSDNDAMIEKLCKAGVTVVRDDLGEVPHAQHLVSYVRGR